ncbi:MAG: hypothetical protein ACI9GZ_004482, partial [Bacteroidia bacterium]
FDDITRENVTKQNWSFLPIPRYGSKLPLDRITSLYPSTPIFFLEPIHR